FSRLLEKAHQFVASFDRPNIRYTIAESGKVGAREQLWRFIETEHPKDAGIVYCLSRKQTEETAAWLNKKGRNALAYHAGLPADVRAKTQSRFLAEDGMIVVATIAFGMGIDKPDVRFVAHLSLPKSIEAYYQETGRAGRDGGASNAWMVYGFQDLIQQRQWIDRSDGPEAFQRVQRQKLDALIGLCEAATCRRQILLAYFGETGSEPCGNCDNCLQTPETVDGTVLAQKALSAIFRTEERFGVTYLLNVLAGKSDARIVQNRHDQLSVFGIGADVDPQEWRGVFRQLLSRGYIEQDAEGHQTLQLTPSARPLLRGEETFMIRRGRPAGNGSRAARAQRRNKASADTVPAEHRALFDALRAVRTDLAREASVPPYVICHDRTLAELAEKQPTTRDGLADIIGLGKTKIQRYGDALIAAVTAFVGQGGQSSGGVAAGGIDDTRAALQAGQSVDAIAERRGVDVDAVYGDCAELIEKGALTVDQIADLEPADLDAIHAVFEQCGTLESGDVAKAHGALEKRVPAGLLKCVLAELV
ncbi:MAG: RecQ family ATP-dependent DNA helicase, partial [Pseudomonadota bacterium]